MEIIQLLKYAVKSKASDLHLKADQRPVLRIDGKLKHIMEARQITGEELERIAQSILNNDQQAYFAQHYEIDTSYQSKGLGRFRVSIFRQKGQVSFVFRIVPIKIESLKDLTLPPVVQKISEYRRGLVLVTGITGSGKSTTLASMVDHINAHHPLHIVTIEDPIEYVLNDKKSIVNQREVGLDTKSFSNALRGALRQDPDIILIGEMRDQETMETALTAAETGHLVISTMHTLNAVESVNRILAMFPSHQQKQIRMQLAAVLKAVISQRLVLKKGGKGRVPACEIMIASARVQELIEDPASTKLIHEAIEEGSVSYGMQSFDQSLMHLFKSNFIDRAEAISNASNPEDFKLKLSGISSTTGSTQWDQFSENTAQINEKKSLADLDAMLDNMDVERF